MENRFVSKELFEKISSSEFCQEIEKHGPKRCAQFWFRVGGQFNLDYTRTRSLESLDHAIVLSQRAVDTIRHLPDLNEDAVRYVVILVHLWQEKAGATQSIVDQGNCIRSINLKIELTKDGSLHDEAVAELGCAYFSRFNLSNDQADLHQTLDILEKHLVAKEARFPEAALFLGCALYHRFLQSSGIGDLERALDVHRIALDSMPPDHQLRKWGYLNLVKYCLVLSRKEPSVAMSTRLAATAREALVDGPANEEDAVWLNAVLCEAVSRNYFERPRSFSQFADAVALLDVDQHQNPKGSTDSSDVLGAGVEKLRISDDGVDMFGYTELLDSRSYIRLLKLESGQGHDEIRCTIPEVLHTSAPPYEALSYVWGDGEDLQSILINGASHRITRNLYAALSRLRFREGPRILWVDAICINQENLDEKKDQIKLMSQIYKKPEHVIMWLGEHHQKLFDDTKQATADVDDQILGADDRNPPVEMSGVQHTSSNSPGITQRDSYRRESSPEGSAEAATRILQDYGTAENAQKVLNDALDQIRQVIYGAKPAVMTPTRHLSPELCNTFHKVVEDLDVYGQMELMLQERRVQSLVGTVPTLFDWTQLDQIPSFFEAPLSPEEWPILAAFYLIHELASGKHFHELPFFSRDEEIVYSSSQAWIKAASALRDMLESSYWDRAWITQEVVLARDPILYFGPHVMPFTTLNKAYQNFNHHYLNCCGKWGNKAYQKDCSWWTAIYKAFRQFGHLARLRNSHTLEEPHLSQAPPDLLQILKAGIGRYEATDPRDHIYGLLSLGQNRSEEMIEADYTLSVAAVFANVAFRIIEQEKSLSILNFNELRHGNELNLPSWTPDWTCKSARFSSRPYSFKLYHASKGAEPLVKVQDDLCLSTQSVKVDTVSQIGARRTLSWEHPQKLLTLIGEWRYIAGLNEPDKGSHSDRRTTEQCFWRTLFADSVKLPQEEGPPGKERRIQETDFDTIYRWWQWLQETSETFNGSEWNDLRSIADEEGNGLITDSFWKATEMRRLFVTSNGWLGTGVASLEDDTSDFMNVDVGDEIHVALGSKVPFVLRPVGAEASMAETQKRTPLSATPRACHHGCERVYRMVGTCYVQGIMDGQAMDDATLEKGQILIR